MLERERERAKHDLLLFCFIASSRFFISLRRSAHLNFLFQFDSVSMRFNSIGLRFSVWIDFVNSFVIASHYRFFHSFHLNVSVLLTVSRSECVCLRPISRWAHIEHISIWIIFFWWILNVTLFSISFVLPFIIYIIHVETMQEMNDRDKQNGQEKKKL